MSDTELEPEIAPVIEAEQVTDQKFYAKRKLISLDWSAEDNKVLTEIREVAEGVYLGIFGSTLSLIEEIYDSVREQSGDSNWGLLTTKHLENHMLALSKDKIGIALQLKNVQMDALFAKYKYEDAKNSTYIQLKGPHALRDAHSEESAWDEKYQYFFRFVIYTMCDGLSREIDGLIKNLNSVLYRRGSNG